MDMKKLVFSLIACISLSGCVNVVKHVPLGQTVDVYRPTCFVACDAVGVWWNDSYSKKYPIEATWMKFTWFVWVVDLPCEAVMDTLTLPYDYYCMKRHEKSGNGGAFKAENPYGTHYELKSGSYSIDMGGL